MVATGLSRHPPVSGSEVSFDPLWDQITAMFPGLPDTIKEFTLHMIVGEVPTITVEFYVLDRVTDSGEVPSVTRSFRIEEYETDEVKS